MTFMKFFFVARRAALWIILKIKHQTDFRDDVVFAAPPSEMTIKQKGNNWNILTSQSINFAHGAVEKMFSQVFAMEV